MSHSLRRFRKVFEESAVFQWNFYFLQKKMFKLKIPKFLKNFENEQKMLSHRIGNRGYINSTFPSLKCHSAYPYSQLYFAWYHFYNNLTSKRPSNFQRLGFHTKVLLINSTNKVINCMTAEPNSGPNGLDFSVNLFSL